MSAADRALLQLKPLRPFAKGEVCAVEAAELAAPGSGKSVAGIARDALALQAQLILPVDGIAISRTLCM